jgi:hypothetical protein
MSQITVARCDDAISNHRGRSRDDGAKHHQDLTQTRDVEKAGATEMRLAA